MIFGKKRESELRELYESGDYDSLLNYIYRYCVETRKIKDKECIPYVEKIIEKSPSAKAYYVLSVLLIPDEKGLKYAVKAFEMEPANQEYAENLMMYYSEGMKDYDSSMKVCEKYWEASGDTKWGISVAEYHIKNNNYEKARKICEKILLQEPDNKKASKILKKLKS